MTVHWVFKHETHFRVINFTVIDQVDLLRRYLTGKETPTRSLIQDTNDKMNIRSMINEGNSTNSYNL